MAILSFLVNLAGAVMLLLYAVRMVRTGIERAFGASFTKAVSSLKGPVRSFLTGVGLAAVLQSSSAVGLLVAGFAGASTIAFVPGLAAVLGADLGSAFLVQAFSLNPQWMVPLLLAVGGTLFIKFDAKSAKQFGRIVLGVAFILIALRYLRETMVPIQDSSFLPAISGYLASDYVTAFLVGAALAWLMHSSLAAILTFVTLVDTGALPVVAGVSLVLGANLGSSIIPVFLTRSFPAAARRIPLANLALRGSWAIAALILVNQTSVLDYLQSQSGAQTMMNVHMVFNAALLLALPFLCLVERPMKALAPDGVSAAETPAPEHVSSLDYTVIDNPALALANLKRELIRMEGVLEAMAKPVMLFFEKWDDDAARRISEQDDIIDSALDGIRRYVASLPAEKFTKAEIKRAHEMAEYAIALEACGDLIDKAILPHAKRADKKGIKFSREGERELVAMHESIMANMRLASNVLISDDLQSARLLLEEKNELTQAQRASTKKHLRRLSEGTQKSLNSSNMHLELVRSMRLFNSHVSSVCYPILKRAGHLLETRLIDDVAKGGKASAAK